MAFYDLTEAERIALTQRAIAEGRTVHERWSALVVAEAEPWSTRAALAATFLVGEPAVADLGCGTMALEAHLLPGTAYYPVDAVRRDARTLVCDFNTAPPPATPATAAACLGLLEYVLEPAAFLVALRQSYRTCVLSYCITDAPETPAQRRSHAWVNDFSRASLETLLDETGWQVDRVQPVDLIQVMWRLRAEAT